MGAGRLWRVIPIRFNSLKIMVIFSILFLLLSNAVTLRRDKSILFSRVTITILLYSSLLATGSLYMTYLDTGIGLYGGLFHATSTTQIFHIFIFLISAAILQLTGFYPRKVWVENYSSINKLLFYNFLYYRTKITNKMGEQFKIIEYPLILLFIITGAVFLVSTSDLVSIFLSIELQSYGLYLLSTLYRNSELATSGGLTYFLLGGLSSCFILLGTALLYANSGTTNLDGIYVITSLSDLTSGASQISESSNILYWYKPYYINFSLLILSVGFLFKVSAAPFHFWSPDRGPGKSSLFGNKLPNSGNTLELLVPSHSQKAGGGWTNYSCTVTSQKASEKNVGNRGSKSAICESIAVKEQRVYGSWQGKNLPCLRCILTGFERNYQVKNPSNLIIQRRPYSKGREAFEDNNPTVNNKHTQLIEPWFISGFADAEGCFAIIIRKAPKNNLGWQLEANFLINLHKKDVELLKLIQAYFGGAGRIGKERNGCCDFTIGSLGEILGKIVPHFDKYPLKTQKLADYLLFREVVMMMKRGEHLTVEGLQKIINIRATINKGLSPVLKEAFPNSVAVPRPQLPHLHPAPYTQDKSRRIACVENQSTLALHPQWVAGFTSGDGSFKVSIRESKAYKVGSRVIIIYVLTQHIRDELLLKSLVNFLRCGQVYFYKNHSEFICQSFKDNYEKILPFFRQYPILGVKSRDFEDWGKVAEMINKKAHLTSEGFDQIRQIRAGINKKR